MPTQQEGKRRREGSAARVARGLRRSADGSQRFKLARWCRRNSHDWNLCKDGSGDGATDGRSGGEEGGEEGEEDGRGEEPWAGEALWEDPFLGRTHAAFSPSTPLLAAIFGRSWPGFLAPMRGPQSSSLPMPPHDSSNHINAASRRSKPAGTVQDATFVLGPNRSVRRHDITPSCLSPLPRERNCFVPTNFFGGYPRLGLGGWGGHHDEGILGGEQTARRAFVG
jgi:hypothetical protein